MTPLPDGLRKIFVTETQQVAPPEPPPLHLGEWSPTTRRDEVRVFEDDAEASSYLAEPLSPQQREGYRVEMAMLDMKQARRR